MLATQSFTTCSMTGMNRHLNVRLSTIVMHLLSVFFFFFFSLIKGTKTGDGDPVNIEECLTDGDFVPLKLRVRTGDGDEGEDVAEEQDDDTHESPPSQDQKAMSLFCYPVKGCIKTFLCSSTLQHHMIIDEHVIQSKKETIY